MDLVVKVEHLPRAGETILGSEYQAHHGGKGANQAVAAARSGAEVRMVGAVGSDGFGEQLLAGLRGEGIDVVHVRRQDGKSGVAFIKVDSRGQNNIVVSPGANGLVTPASLEGGSLTDATWLLLQLEIPLETVKEAARLARRAGARVMLNLAPARRLSAEELSDIDLLVVNEMEAGTLLGGDGPREPGEALAAAARLRDRVPRVVITMGDRGAVWADGNGRGHVEAHEVVVKDTTASGDAFVGMLAARLDQGDPLGVATRWANAAAALTATAEGAQPSLPGLARTEAFLAKSEKTRR